jgi:hypothetical protein
MDCVRANPERERQDGIVGPRFGLGPWIDRRSGRVAKERGRFIAAESCELCPGRADNVDRIKVLSSV